MNLPETASICEWCSEVYCNTNDDHMTEDGKYHCCSRDCLDSLEQNLEENKEQHRFEVACYESERGI